MSDHSGNFWPRAAMDEPLLEPDSLECAAGNLSDGGGEVRSSQGSKARLRSRGAVRVSGVDVGADGLQDQECYEISLVEDIHMGPGREVAAVADVAEDRIEDERVAGVASVLHQHAGIEIRQVVDAFDEGL